MQRCSENIAVVLKSLQCKWRMRVGLQINNGPLARVGQRCNGARDFSRCEQSWLELSWPFHGNAVKLRLRTRRSLWSRLIKRISKRTQNGRKALRDFSHLGLLEAWCAAKTSIRTTSMAPFVARAETTPRSDPWLHVRWPALDATFLLQEPSLSIDMLDNAAANREKIHGDRCEDCAPENLPSEIGMGNFLALRCRWLHSSAFLCGLHLLLQARLSNF